MKIINYTREDIIRRTGDKLNLTHDEMKLILDTTLDTVAEMLTEDKSRIRIELRKFGIFEVKPTKDLRPPVGGKGKKKSTVLYEMKTYQMNRDKFASARKWCDDRNIIFDIWTEKHLRQKG